jgi:hypothetical protein
MFSYLATPKHDLGQYGIARNFAKSMKHETTAFLTVFSACLAAMWRGYWLVTPFNNIARYVERMLGSTPTSEKAHA